jgi:predicted  nucleic acid-binding Zn-ribbon protein
MTTQRTFVQKVLAIIKGGDEAKLIRFESRFNSHVEKQINIRKDEIKDLEDKLVDSKQDLDDAIVSVDFSEIQDTESTKRYCSEYLQSLLRKQDSITSLQDQIADKKEEIVRFESVVKAIADVDPKVEA